MTPLQIYTFAWIFGFFTSMLIYYVICTYVSPPTKSMIEEAVYPPQKGDLESAASEKGSMEKQSSMDKQMGAKVTEVSSA